MGANNWLNRQREHSESAVRKSTEGHERVNKETGRSTDRKGRKNE